MILKKEIIRKKVILPSVEFEELSNNRGYIAINMF
jgi:hypothetical protein